MSNRVEWTGSVSTHRTRLASTVAILVVVPRPLWIWFVLVQPAFAFAAVPWVGTYAFVAFSGLAVAPGIAGWLMVGSVRNASYELDPDRSTLTIRHPSEGPASFDDPDDVQVDLRDCSRVSVIPVPSGEYAICRLSYDGLHRRERRTAPRLAFVPRCRRSDLVRALERVDGPALSTRPRNHPLLTIRTVLSVLVPFAGIGAGIGVLVVWLFGIGLV